METAKTVTLIVSITLNVFLGYALVGALRPPPATPGSIDEMVVSSPEENRPAASYPASSLPADPVPPTTAEDVSSFDEMPPNLVKQAFLQELDREYASQATPSRYWLADARDDDALDAIRIEREKRSRVLAEFGAAAIDDPIFEGLFKPLQNALGFLSSDSQIALRELLTQHDAAEAVRSERRVRRFSPSARAPETLESAIQSVLTPDEYFEYQLRESRKARRLASELDGFEYSEEEFRDLFRFQLEYEADLRARQPGESLQDLVAKRDQAMRGYLGDYRYAELKRTKDPVYNDLRRIGEQYGAEEEEILDVYSATRQVLAQARELDPEGQMSTEDRREALTQLSHQLFDRTVAIVGEETAESMRSTLARMVASP